MVFNLLTFVGATRLERATAWSQTRNATNCATPRRAFLLKALQSYTFFLTLASEMESFLRNDFDFGESQEKLFLSYIVELDGCLGIKAAPFEHEDCAATKTIVVYY